MTYLAQEQSEQDGAPIELISFAYGSAEYNYTSSERDYTTMSESEPYVSIPITIPDIESSPEQARNGLEIIVPRDNDVALLFQSGIPEQRISVTIRRVHRTDGDDEIAVIWLGVVLSVEWTGAEAKLRCEPIDISLERPGLGRSYSRICPLILYRQGLGQCNVDRSLHETATTVTSNSGVTLVVAALDVRPYAGGYVEWTADGIVRRVSIRTNTSTTITLSRPAPTLMATDPVTVVPGCDHTRATCRDLFNNEVNYGGQPLIPLKNPFDGTPLF